MPLVGVADVHSIGSILLAAGKIVGLCATTTYLSKLKLVGIAGALNLPNLRAQEPVLFGDFYPLKRVPIVRVDSDGPELVPAEWGLLPNWWKPSDRTPKRTAFQRRTFNARSETAHEKPSFREAFKSRRCLLPGTAFFEKGHYFFLQDRHPFAFAGLWENWTAEGEDVLSCTMLTTKANEAVRSVGHDRMPVMLTTPETRGLWLSPDVAEKDHLEVLFQPLSPEYLKFEPA